MRTPQPTTTLPPPSPEALLHVNACREMLCDDIRAHGGWIPFARFMDRVLYAPGLGYYAAGATKFGPSGDFITAPEVSPLFGACLAQSLAPTLTANGGDVLELGAGSGQLAVDLLLAFDQLGVLPRAYLILEVSGELRLRQQQKIAALPGHLAARVKWMDALPTGFVGAVVANEVLDVVPVHLASFAAGWVFERGVALKEGEFVWQDAPQLPQDVQALVNEMTRDCFQGVVPEGYLTEFAPQAGALVRAVNDAVQDGVVLWIDYGFRRAEFYHPSRSTGTLMCHYRHHAHTDPFFLPGLQDITAHVDFSLVAEAGIGAGAELIGYCNQANFLLAAGIADLIARQHRDNPADAARHLGLSNQVQRLTSPAEMGEFFKVIGFGKAGRSVEALARARQLPL